MWSRVGCIYVCLSNKCKSTMCLSLLVKLFLDICHCRLRPFNDLDISTRIPKHGNTAQIYKTHDLLGPLVIHIWPITHLVSHLTPRVTCWDFPKWVKLHWFFIQIEVPTFVHTLPSHLGNQMLVPSITSWIVTMGLLEFLISLFFPGSELSFLSPSSC